MTTHKVIEWLAENHDAMVAQLEKIVNIDSNSYDPEGVNAVAATLRGFMESHGLPCEVSPLTGRGNALHGRLDDGSGRAPVLLMGHMDTVFPTGEVARRPFTTDGDLGYGPGAADMKAGLVMNAFILAAFARTGGAPLPLHALFTGDEEIGTRASRPVILDAANAACAVFNAEPGRKSGNIVDNRRGGAFYHVDITGISAHAGLNPHDGRSAIHDLGRKIVAWTALNDAERDISVNVGLVSGGQSVNSVAPNASAEIDLRFARPEDESRMEERIRDIALACEQDGVSATFERLGGFSPIHQSAAGHALRDLYLQAAADLGQATQAEFTRSCADSGLASSTGTPTICATGPVGDKAHSPDEWVDLSTFVPRAQAVALAILRLADQPGAVAA